MSHYMAIITYHSNHSLWYWNFFMHNLRNKRNEFAQIFFISMFNNTFKRIFVAISQTTQETFHTQYNNNKILFVYDIIGLYTFLPSARRAAAFILLVNSELSIPTCTGSANFLYLGYKSNLFNFIIPWLAP